MLKFKIHRHRNTSMILDSSYHCERMAQAIVPCTYLLFLPVQLINCPLKFMHALPQSIVTSSVLGLQIIVSLLQGVVDGLSQPFGCCHLRLCTLLVVAAEVLPLLRGGASIEDNNYCYYTMPEFGPL